jgi:hypothetical protein
MTPEGGRMAAADLFHQSSSVVEPPCVKCESQSGKHSAQRKVRCRDVSCWISHRISILEPLFSFKENMFTGSKVTVILPYIYTLRIASPKKTALCFSQLNFTQKVRGSSYI